MGDVEAIKRRQQHLWGLGDYSVLSRQLAPAAVELGDACAVSAGQEVLDVAAGDGNFALACAREGASVVACDFSPRMVELGRARSDDEGYDVEWVEADAEALPFEDARFDCAGSVFGAFLTPRPGVVASELFRVVRPGNTVGLTAWAPDSVFIQLFAAARRLLPPPLGMPLPEEWGDEATARERLADLAAHVEIDRRTLVWTAGSPEALGAQLADSAPSFAGAREALSEEQFEELREETLELLRRLNTADDGSVRINADYLVIVARKRG
ncbi:MAG: methyltransferase domain-containing protein [Thermoleophilaceae bacterium]|nr:methyltransferase domain-containing protein [Thermoleophilaceae bacterium]